MNKIRTFLSLLKFEVIKIYRNKLLFVFLLVFPLLMTLTLNSIKFDNLSKPNPQQSEQNQNQQWEIENNPNGKIALFIDGQLQDQSQLEKIIKDYNNEIRLVASFEQGENLLKTWEVYFFVAVDAAANPVSATFYYDNSSNAGNLLVDQLRNKQLKYTYQSVIDFLASYGITLNEQYFNLISFKAIQHGKINQNQRIMPLTSSFVATIIMFGLAYTMARDNETNVIKQISYTPIKTHTYLLSKAIPFLILGFVQGLLLMLVGTWIYGVQFQAHFAIIALVYALFVCASTSLGLVFSCVNNQTTSTFATMVAILLPILAVFLAYVNTYPLAIQIFVYAFPLTAFLQIFTQLTFSGVLVPFFVVILCAQIFGYYFLAYTLASKKAGK